MAEYIERDSVLNLIGEHQKSLCPLGLWGRRFSDDKNAYDEWQVVLDEIDSIPAADVAPVVHGHWVLEAEKGICMDFRVKAHCSECGHKWFGKNGVGNYSYVFSAFVRGPDEDAIAFVLREASKIKIDRFCSDCGAKMDKGATDGD